MGLRGRHGRPFPEGLLVSPLADVRYEVCDELNDEISMTLFDDAVTARPKMGGFAQLPSVRWTAPEYDTGTEIGWPSKELEIVQPKMPRLRPTYYKEKAGMPKWEEFVCELDDGHQMSMDRDHVGWLCRIVSKLDGSAGVVVELGAFRGYTTAALSLACPPKHMVISVDLCDTIPQEERVKYWQSLGVVVMETPPGAGRETFLADNRGTILPVPTTSSHYLSVIKESGYPVDFLLHDTIHGHAAIPEYELGWEVTRQVMAIHDTQMLQHRDEFIRSLSSLSAVEIRVDKRGRETTVLWKEQA